MRGLALVRKNLLMVGVVALLAPAVGAQTQISFSSCSVKGSNLSASGNCTVTPFGTMMVSVSLTTSATTQTLTLQASFSSGSGTFSATAANQPYSSSQSTLTSQGTGNITGGTGAFAGASGSFNYSLSGMGPPNNETAMFTGSGTISVQTVAMASLPDGMVGIPYSINVGQSLSQIAAGAQFAVSAGSSLPPGLTLSASGLLSGTPTQPGNYMFSMTFQEKTQSGTLQATLNVTASPGPALTVNPGVLNFSLTQGSSSVVTQSIVIANSASAAENFRAAATPSSGSNWLSVSPATGTVAPFTSGSVTVSVNPSGLGAGTYLGTVSIAVSPANQQFGVAVLVTVSSGQAQLQLSQSGFRFQTIDGGGDPPSQSVTILNSGSGSLKISASASTTSGGQWLSATTSSSTVTSSKPASVVVSIASQGLESGNYYGQVQISADGAANSPQTASVVLNIAPEGTDLGAFIYPYGLIFVGQSGGSNPDVQTISVTNPSPSTLTFSAGTYFGQPTPWFTVQPVSAPVNAGSPATITVQPVAGLVAGIYVGSIQLQFAEDGSSRNIAVLLIVVPGSAGSTARAVSAASSCNPTKLLPVFTQLGSNFSTVAAWPTPVEVTVVDDCGNFLTSGSVTASFSDGDPALPLASLNNGSWSATWQPRSSSAQVVITADAVESAPPIQGTQSIGGALQANPTTPSINAGGVVSAAKSAQNQPLAPGSFTSIYGVHLSAGQNPALSLPLATELGATQVVLGGRPLPLQYAADGQVNAVIPYDVPLNTTQQLIISNGPALSVPQPVVVASAQPAVFAQGDGSGVVFDVKPGQTAQVLVDANHPMSAGDAIVIYCAGLGAVEPLVAAGSAAPSSPPATTTNPVTVTIGSQTAQVFFSGLVGGFAGLYQVNAYVPKGITPGDALPLVITVAGFESAPVTVAVK
jgi:uncharacterized protein (TIGR03437 family)